MTIDKNVLDSFARGEVISAFEPCPACESEMKRKNRPVCAKCAQKVAPPAGGRPAKTSTEDMLALILAGTNTPALLLDALCLKSMSGLMARLRRMEKKGLIVLVAQPPRFGASRSYVIEVSK